MLVRTPMLLLCRSSLMIRSFSGSTGGGIAKEAPKPSPKLLPENFKKFVEIARPAKKTLILGICCLPGALVSMMALPLVVGKVIDLVSTQLTGANGELTETLVSQGKSLGLILIGLSLFGSAATFGRSYFINVSSEKIVKHMRANLFSRLIKSKPASFYDTAKTGDLVNRIASDTTVIANFVSESVSMGLRGFGTLTFGFGFLVYTSPILASVSVCSLLPLVAFARLFGNKMKRETNEQLNAFGESSAVAEESLSSAKVIQMFNREEHQVSIYEGEMQKVFAMGRKLCLTRAQFFGVIQLIMDTTMISLIGTGSYLVFSNVLTPGQLTSFLMYAFYVAGANFQLTSVYSAAMKALGATQRIEEITQDLTEREKILPPFFQTKGDRCEIEFKNVIFAYPSRAEDIILNDFNLTIPAGKVVAVVGHSGCGKSTLISLLTKLYSPLGGQILLRNVDSSSEAVEIGSVDTENFRENIGVVTQDPVIFMTSIADNIRFGNLDATHDQIVEAAKFANIDEFIETLPDKYETIVGQRGSTLSGGQKQRICIARAILRDPGILLLDEATSSLDVQSETVVQVALDKLMLGRTSIVVAHRLSTIKNADYVAVLEKGRVVQFGKLDDIKNESGAFQDLVRSQNMI